MQGTHAVASDDAPVTLPMEPAGHGWNVDGGSHQPPAAQADPVGDSEVLVGEITAFVLDAHVLG